MAGVGFKAQVSDVASGTSPKTIMQIVAASNHGVLLDEIRVSFESTTVIPLVELVTQTTAGTSDELTLVEDPPGATESLQVTARHNVTVEPTTDYIRESQYVTGVWVWRWPKTNRLKIDGGTRLGIRVDSGTSVNCSVTVVGEE